MTRATPRHRAAWVGAAVVLVALVSVTGCVMPRGSVGPAPSAVATLPPSASPEPSSTPLPATPTPSSRPSCPPIAFTTFVASERLTDARIVPGAGGDLVGFVLAPSPGSPMRPRLTVEAVDPPFADGGSGLPLEVAGEHHVLLRFEGMLHIEESGEVVYTGPNRQPGIGGPVQQVELTEAFESYVSFIVGYDGTGCVFLEVTPALITLLVEAR